MEILRAAEHKVKGIASDQGRGCNNWIMGEWSRCNRLGSSAATRQETGVETMTELLLWLTMTVYFEARGEPQACQVKVARVVLNRMKDGDIKKVILAPRQFSWVSDKMDGDVIKPGHRPNIESAAWKRSEESARKAIYSTEKFAATHFHNKSVNPNWGLKFYKTCGEHHFYV